METEEDFGFEVKHEHPEQFCIIHDTTTFITEGQIRMSDLQLPMPS